MRDDELRELLADVDWLRALARRLSCDDHVADDLVQETCEIALRKAAPPAHWRSWLVGVLRTLVMAHRRKGAERARTLTLVPKAEAPEGAATVVQRAEVHQMLMSAVMQLEEPYRSTVLLRYFENLPPRDIAERQHLPIATVHSRLQRAMQQLRSRLDRDAGSRAKWLGLAAPFAWPDAVVRTGAPRIGRTAALAAGAVAIVAAGVWWASEPATPTPTIVAVAPSPPAASEPSFAAAPLERLAANDLPAATPEVTKPTPTTYEVRGRVIDCNGVGVGSLPISAVLGEPGTSRVVRNRFTTTGSDGTFAGRLDASTASLVVADGVHENVLIGGWRADSTLEPVIVVAPALRVGGRVVEADGRAVSGGVVTCELPVDMLSRLRARVDRSSSSNWSTTVGEDGSFAFSVPKVDGAVLRFVATACAPAAVPLPEVAPTNMHVVLAPLRVDAAPVRGRVLAHDGTPAFGAFVVMDDRCTVADRDGGFAFDGAPPAPRLVVTAVMRGFLPARHELGANGSARDLLLQLGPPAGEVVGVVVDDRGPVPGAEVWIDDPTPFGGPIVGKRELQLEYVIGGAPLQSRSWDASGLASKPEGTAAKRGRGGAWVIEDLPTAAWQFVRTDADGRFVLPGLLQRAYRLRAFDPRTGRIGEIANVVASDRPRLELPSRSAGITLRGRVVSAGGLPIAGAMVEQMFEVFTVGEPDANPTETFKVLRMGRVAISAKDGTVVLPAVHLTSAFLMIDGEAVMPTRIDGIATMQGNADDPPPLLRVDRRCPAEVVLADPKEADAAIFLDAGRRTQFVGLQTANDKQQVSWLPLHGGRSGPIAIGERVVSCLLMRAGRPVREVVITAAPEHTALVQ